MTWLRGSLGFSSSWAKYIRVAVVPSCVMADQVVASFRGRSLRCSDVLFHGRRRLLLVLVTFGLMLQVESGDGDVSSRRFDGTPGMTVLDLVG